MNTQTLFSAAIIGLVLSQLSACGKTKPPQGVVALPYAHELPMQIRILQDMSCGSMESQLVNLSFDRVDTIGSGTNSRTIFAHPKGESFLVTAAESTRFEFKLYLNNTAVPVCEGQSTEVRLYGNPRQTFRCNVRDHSSIPAGEYSIEVRASADNGNTFSDCYVINPHVIIRD